jgi:hypothetical protein
MDALPGAAFVRRPVVTPSRWAQTKGSLQTKYYHSDNRPSAPGTFTQKTSNARAFFADLRPKLSYSQFFPRHFPSIFQAPAFSEFRKFSGFSPKIPGRYRERASNHNAFQSWPSPCSALLARLRYSEAINAQRNGACSNAIT